MTGRKVHGYIKGSKLVVQIDGKARTYRIRNSEWRPAPETKPDTTTGGKIAPVADPGESEASPVSIKSTPDGADIIVDEKYVGSTPSVIQMAAGDHEIEIAKAGFKAWKRQISVSPGGQVTISATLDKETPR